MSSIFKARTGYTSGPVVKSNYPSAEELTKNKHYCVSRLPGLPNVFKTTSFSNAYSDAESNYAVVISDDSIYVWCYKSVDASPFSIHFPIDKSLFKLPVAILTRPSSGTDQDPGIVMVDSLTGLIKFYESVQHAPTLGLINDKSLELQIDLQPNEYITLVENVEPAGIAVATSLQRCILISLRDYKSKPHLSTIELTNPHNGFLSKIFRHNGGDVVAIRSASVGNNDTSQVILILDSVGTLYSVTYYLLSSTTAPYVDKSSSFKQTLSIDPDTYPGSGTSAKFLDIWPMKDDKYFLALVRSSGALLLATFRADKSGALYYGSHQLKASGDITTPRLFLPRPGKTAFVIIGNSVIITDLDTSYIEPKNTFTYTKPRWEDVIRFNPATNVIGYGYENQSVVSNPSIIVITENYGILRVEKFPATSQKEINYDPALLVMSHIEQAIFFSDSKEIDFDLVQNVDKATVHNAVISIIEEVMTSTSPYLPDALPVTTDLTQLKVKILTELIAYCQRNFPNDTPMIAEAVKNLEKTNCALNLWRYIDANKSYMDEFKKIKPDPRQFFISEIASIVEVLTLYLRKLEQTALSTTSLVVTTIYDGVYLNSVRYSDKIGKSWLFDTDLIRNIESQFTQAFVTGDDNDKYDASCIVQILYYFFTNAIKFTKEHKIDSQYEEYTNLYNEKKNGWTTALLKLGLVKEAMVISEKYYDFASLARILATERETKPIEELNYGFYFEEFGYPFAASVYEYYIKSGDIQRLLLEFTNYKPFLLQFFKENPKLTSNVSWIRYLIDEDFTQASKALGLAESYNTESVDNQLTQLSLGKLSAIAAGTSTVKKFDDELLKVRYQIMIRDAVAGHGRIAAIKQTNFVNQFINTNINKSDAKNLAANAFDALSVNYRLSESLLIELLTIIEPKFLSNDGFLYALKVAQTYSNEEVVNAYTNIILLRLLTLATKADHATDGTDEEIKHEVESSILFKTLLKQPHAITQLNQLLKNPDFNGNTYQPLPKFNQKLVDELKKRLGNKSFKTWVHLVEEQAKIILI
ncbi:NUP133 [Candida margitis]|uniref:NUP133 n=1 Tax=Candida margitis TaxID=1775924 RepID=UPI002225E8AC|nr:NUP133 [Candida margitis]KAI5960862.1 NUP133 [Candida margitis]